MVSSLVCQQGSARLEVPVHALTVGAFQHVLELLVCQLDHVKVDAGLVENFRDRDLALAMLNHGLINFCRAAPHKVQVFLERLFEGERAVTVGAFEFPARPVTMAGPQVDEVLVGADVSDVATVATTDAVGAFNVVFLEVVPQVEAVGVDVATVRAHGGVTSLKLKFGSEGEGLGRLEGVAIDVVHEVFARMPQAFVALSADEASAAV